ncbi:acyclic terpene utilization AtuA family protein [Nonomuraea sp. K274]|uniref:Acyclic terpene utilization AtuA family protein n=1 Tax=Nonomuraea cypriaca TaxID=1187855 RepID=A0A931ADU8_9ACTN|nr:acyclic terpene utilization AtuA family protein [Nonomuraea cypriaca]MBF8188354.1 acyclic terpene utilization AtuA family protein [Nonomuraea cypriaca]
MIKAVAATGQLGTGFKAHTLAEAAEGADFIGCDAGSSDPGPYYLGSGGTQASDEAIARDLELMIAEGVKHDIPVLIGSAGTAGARPHLDRTVDIVRRLAAKNGWHFPLAVVNSEIPAERVVKAYRDGGLTPLNGAPEISEESIRAAEHIVAMQGPECFADGLEQGAKVVIAGRASDTSIFAAVPMMRGIPEGIAFHAAKILECGAASVVERKYPDSMVALLDSEGFTVEPPNPDMACTPQSVASHTFYETADPFRLVEPNGTLVTTNAVYTAVSDRAVRVTGSAFEPTSDYTVKLEAATLLGHRTIVLAGVRDPLVVGRIEHFVDATSAVIKGKVADSLGLSEDDYRIRWNIYGKNGTLGPFEPEAHVTGHEVALLIDIVARDQHTAQAIGSVAWHTALHQPIPEYSGLVSHLAFPVSPPAIAAGPVYEFSINHVMHIDDPGDTYSLTIQNL